MKKFLSLLLVLALGVSAHAVEPKLLSIASDVSTTGGKTITCNISAVSGRKIVIYNVIGRSDLSTSVLQFQESDTAGAATYTTLVRLDVGAATRQYNNNGEPLFVGKLGYGYRFLINSTTANSVIATYTYQ